MKKTLRSILIVMLALTCAACMAAGLTACSAKAEGLRLENPRTEFKIGDEFETGEDFRVYALFSDKTEKDVTEEAVIRQEAGMDMNVPDDYQITVSWGGKKEVYTIYVSDFDSILRKIELNTDNVKKKFSLGEDVLFSGLTVKCTYENAQGQLYVTETTSLKNFTVKVEGVDGNIVTDVFNELGKYTVTVAMGSIAASFTVDVDNIDISTVQGAIAAGYAFKGKIAAGTHEVWNEQTSRYKVYDYVYEFGDNYTYIHETNENPDNEYHYSIYDSQISCVQLQGGKIIPNNGIQTGMMNGTPFRIWYNRLSIFGPENLLTELHKAAKECTNKDLTEKADPDKREYSFSFSGLVFLSNTSDYYETKVTFRLSEDYTVEYVNFVQDCWQDNTGNALGAPPTFITDGSGHTKPNGNYSIRTDHTATQTIGERTKTNPYSPEALKIKSYDLVYNGAKLGDEGVIDCDINSPAIVVEIADMLPTTASMEQDAMYFDYVGNYGGEVNSTTILYCDGFAAFRTGNIIKITLKNGGVWTLKIKTSGTFKTITFNVKGVKPTSMTANIGNATTGKFAAGTQKTLAIGGIAYFKGVVNKYADETQTASVTYGNADNVIIERSVFGGVSCFAFKAVAEGTYKVTVTSDAAADVSCEFTFTVSAMPDYAGLLSGKYSVQNREGDIFTLEFAPAGGDGVSGTVAVTRTPTTEDNTPEYDKQKQQTLGYAVDFENGSIALTHASGENLGISLSVNERGELMLADHFNDSYKLNRVTE